MTIYNLQNRYDIEKLIMEHLYKYRNRKEFELEFDWSKSKKLGKGA